MCRKKKQCVNYMLELLHLPIQGATKQTGEARSYRLFKQPSKHHEKTLCHSGDGDNPDGVAVRHINTNPFMHI